MSQKYYAIVTNLGAAKIANAAALGTKLNITQMAVGDGGGTLPTPNASQTKLVNETRRAAINTLSVDPANASQVIAEQVIPETEGGFWIREMGLFDADGTLIAVCNTPETYKPALQEGSGRTQTVRMVLIMNSTDVITLKIDPSVVLATRQYVDDKALEVRQYADGLIDAHLKETNPHPQYATVNSPVLTGTPKAPTAAPGTNNTQMANTAFVQAALSALTGGAPEALNTFKELADALGNDPDFAGTINKKMQQRALLAGSALQDFSVAGGSNGNSAVAYGQFQSGTNGNGAWTKLPGGGLWCRQNITAPGKGSITWTFPASFPATPAIFVAAINGAPNVWFSGIGPASAIIYNNNDSALNVNVLAIW